MGDMVASQINLLTLEQPKPLRRRNASRCSDARRTWSGRARAVLSEPMAVQRGGREVASGKRTLANGKCTLKQIDVTRVARGVIAAGLEVVRMEIDADGKIIVMTGKATSTNEPTTDFDKWKMTNAR
jgi:hypothetical protein